MTERRGLSARCRGRVDLARYRCGKTRIRCLRHWRGKPGEQRIDGTISFRPEPVDLAWHGVVEVLAARHRENAGPDQRNRAY